MKAMDRFVRAESVAIRSFFNRLRRVLAALPLLLALTCAAAQAQNTTISGTVYDPRTTTSALPLPDVLVYATTGPVIPFPSGVQCLTTPDPIGVVSYGYSAADGTFTLANVPENAAYTLVIQVGKWRRQFTETVGTTPLTGLQLHMPANHTEGDMPMIAIVTGKVDGVECLLLHMGIDQSEFSDDQADPSFTDRIHLYKGDGAPGAEISASTPVESSLTANSTTLDNYDMVMFPCQGHAYVQTGTELTNLLNFADAGGRLFTTHYSYVYLDPAAPYDAQFPGVANWDLNQASLNGAAGYPATVNTSFTEGETLDQWLQNAGAINPGTTDQIQIYEVRSDVASVIAPTQAWLTLNSGAYAGQVGNPVMQMTFNTPVGAPAANQCGRVMFNDYHVININVAPGTIFPNECPAEGQMSPQEQMLEFALFDLTTFVQPIVAPTLTIGFNPSPLTVKGGDTADQVTVNVTNTSSDTSIPTNTILTITLPPDVTATAMADATNGWNCTVASLTCTRSTALAPNASDAITLTLSVAVYPSGPPPTGQIVATASSTSFSNNVSNTDQVIFLEPSGIAWATPSPIIYGTALSATQLDATSLISGGFSYTPDAGTILVPGQQPLSTLFTPTDLVDYTTQTAGVTLTVLKATPVVTLTSGGNPAYVSDAVTFEAAVPAPGSQPSPPTGTVTFYDGSTLLGTSPLSAGIATVTTSSLPLGPQSVTAVYSGDSNYNAATGGMTRTLLRATPVVTLTSGGNPVFTTASVTFTAAVPVPGGQTSAPTGSVNFYDGSTLIGTGTLSAGTATVTTSSLSFGAHPITAVYSGDSNYTTATSTPLSEAVQDFTVASAPGGGTATVTNGAKFSYPLVVTPLGGATLPGTVSLTFSGLPAAADAVLTPATVAAHSGATDVTLEILLPGHSMAAPPANPFGGGSLPVELGLMFLPLAGLRRKFVRRWSRLLMLAIAAAALAVGMSGCNHFDLTPKPFSITVTGTAGALSHSTTVQLTVQ